MSFKVILRNWVNGDLQGFEEDFESLERAMERVEELDRHHRKHSNGHLLKVLNESGEVVHAHNGTPGTDSYA